ncbi:MAG: D-glutamate cyclase family protein, partial [Candidatus Fonsibacter sp.]
MLNITDPVEARKIIRADKYDKQTAGIAGKYVQGNLCILPSKYAIDFAAFCQKNPKPCPLIGFGTKGNPYLKDLGDIDIRTDVPKYRIWKNGEIIDEPCNIKKYWNDDLVVFVLGFSMSFELPLMEAGIEMQHIKNNTTVPMYKTNIDCEPAGP